jgi:hypothetical protein
MPTIATGCYTTVRAHCGERSHCGEYHATLSKNGRHFLHGVLWQLGACNSRCGTHREVPHFSLSSNGARIPIPIRINVFAHARAHTHKWCAPIEMHQCTHVPPRRICHISTCMVYVHLFTHEHKNRTSHTWYSSTLLD